MFHKNPRPSAGRHTAGGRKRLAALALAGTVLLTGCDSMLERTYTVTMDYPEHPRAADDPNVLKAETYQDLVNAILYFVSEVSTQGDIRLFNYPGDVETDLRNACLEVAQDAPLGAYSVGSITYECTRVVQYYEATIHITYSRSLEQIRSIQSVTGSSAIRRALQDRLTHFSPEAVLRISYFTEGPEAIAELLRQAYYNSPSTALGMPDYELNVYPDSGQERIVELLFAYPDEANELRRKSQLLLRQVDLLSASLSGTEGADTAIQICSLLRQKVSPAAIGTGNTAYAALMENRADDEGLALAFQLLADSNGLDSTLVRGVRNGRVHFWNVVTLPSGRSRHVDPSRPEKVMLLSDASMTKLGYVWDTDDVPLCIGPEPFQETIPFPRPTASFPYLPTPPVPDNLFE